jgi:protein O-GlcNAc transferase
MNRKERRIRAKQEPAAMGAELDGALREAERLHAGGQSEDAASLCQKILARDAQHLPTLVLIAELAYGSNQIDKALAYLRRAIALDGSLFSLHINIGLIYERLERLDEAVRSARRAIALEPRAALAHNNLGNALSGQGNIDEAILSYRTAIEIDPALDIAYRNLGGALAATGQLEDALSCYRQALEIRPDFFKAHSSLLMTLTYGAIGSRDDYARAHQAWRQALAATQPPASPAIAADRRPDRRLRIGLVSPNLHAHPVAYFIEGPWREFDRDEIELFAYADIQAPDAVTARLQKSAVTWRDIAGLGDGDVAQHIRSDGIDILVDLAGHTARNRLAVFATKPAPIQASYLGYSATTGLPEIDYLITDEVAHPADGTDWTAEALWRLPRCMLCYKPPAEARLVPRPADGPIVFGSFNALAKLGTATIALWSGVLRALPDSQLLLKSHGLGAADQQQRLRALFAAHGIARERIHFMARTASLTQHFEAYGRIDIALDPTPYSGTTTTADALWMGVPVLTLAGTRMVERMSATMLTALGLSDWIADSEQDYIARAAKFAADRSSLAALRQGQRQRMADSPLCDSAGMARALEQAFRIMWQRYVAAGAPASGI